MTDRSPPERWRDAPPDAPEPELALKRLLDDAVCPAPWSPRERSAVLRLVLQSGPAATARRLRRSAWAVSLAGATALAAVVAVVITLASVRTTSPLAQRESRQRLDVREGAKDFVADRGPAEPALRVTAGRLRLSAREASFTVIARGSSVEIVVRSGRVLAERGEVGIYVEAGERIRSDDPRFTRPPIPEATTGPGASRLAVEAKLFATARRAHDEGRFVDAAAGFDRYLSSYPSGSFAPEALEGAAEARLEQGRYEEALDVLRSSSHALAVDTLRRPALVLLSARILRERGAEGEAAITLRRLADSEAPEAVRAEALFLAGVALWENGDVEGAREAWRGYLFRYPDGARATELGRLLR